MFGLSTAELLEQTVKNACINCKSVYYNAVEENLSLFQNGSEEEQNDIAINCRSEYLNSVFDSVASSLRASDPRNSARLNLVLMSPRLCGYDNIDFTYGIGAGSTFAMCYWALTGKIAAAKTCIRLNHFQNDIINEVLQMMQRQVDDRSQAKYCHKCGAKLKEGSVFCHICGTRIN